MNRLLVVLALLPDLSGPARVGETSLLVAPVRARATYAVSRSNGTGPAIRPHRAAGFTQRVRLRADGRSEVTVLVEPAPLQLSAPWPPDAEAWPASVAPRAQHDEESAPTPVVEEWALRLAAGSLTELEAADRILDWVSRQVRPVDRPDHDDSPAAALGTREASCVGRSRLAVAMLRTVGLPARTIHGLLVPRHASRNEPLGSAEFVLHRFVEVWLTGAGWVPSDPGESLHLVDTRHLVLSVDDEGYDPEEQRELRVTLISPPGPLALASDWRGEPSPLIRRELVPGPPLMPGPPLGSGVRP